MFRLLSFFFHFNKNVCIIFEVHCEWAAFKYRYRITIIELQYIVQILDINLSMFKSIYVCRLRYFIVVMKPISVWGWLGGHDGQRPI